MVNKKREEKKTEKNANFVKKETEKLEIELILSQKFCELFFWIFCSLCYGKKREKNKFHEKKKVAYQKPLERNYFRIQKVLDRERQNKVTLLHTK